MNRPENHLLVIFGASGDLAKRKLIPALYELYCQNLLPEGFAVLGVGRTKLNDLSFRDSMDQALGKFLGKEIGSLQKKRVFLQKLHYISINTSASEDYGMLRERLIDLDLSYKTNRNCIYYLATPPSLYEVIPANLSIHGMNRSVYGKGWKRLIIEKPFGVDLESAKFLNRSLLKYFDEKQIFRIDHYLGKETVQNVLVTRFSNSIFEPLWNRNFVHHVEITAAESLGVEGRGGYYDQSGAMRDMVQNHLLQLLGLVAMEPPINIEAESIRNESIKVLRSLRPLDREYIRENIIRGQYTSSVIKGKEVKGYRDEEGVAEDSRTDTFMAMKFFIDNWRWADVPFYIRTGKHLPARVTEVVIHFRKSPHHLFRYNKGLQQNYNQLILRIQPDEGILLKYGMKVPGAGFQVQDVNMDFHYNSLKNIHLPTAYERLLLDCMQGDATLYARGDAVEASWEFVQPVMDAWNDDKDIKIFGYPAGTWGPVEADDMIRKEGMTWRYPCKNLVRDGEYCEL